MANNKKFDANLFAGDVRIPLGFSAGSRLFVSCDPSERSAGNFKEAGEIRIFSRSARILRETPRQRRQKQKAVSRRSSQGEQDAHGEKIMARAL